MRDIDFRRFRQNRTVPSNIICVYGSDKDIVNSATKQITAQIASHKPANYEIKNLSSDQIGKEPSILIDFFSGASLFGSPQILEVDGVSERHRSIISQLVHTEIDHPSTDYIVLSSSSLKRNSKLLDELRSSASCTIISAYEERMETSDIKAHLRVAGFDNTSDDVFVLLGETAKVLTYNEMTMFLEKITLLNTGNSITEADINEQLPGEVGSLETDYLEALFSGDSQRAIRSLDAFLVHHADPLALSTMLNRQFLDILSTINGQSKVLHFKVQKIVASSQNRVPDFSSRIELAVKELHVFENYTRTNNLKPEIELERCFMRISHIFNMSQK